MAKEETIIETMNNFVLPKWAKLLLFIASLFFVYMGIYPKLNYYYLISAAACIYGMFIEKRTYFTENGIKRKIKSIFGNATDFLAWEDIRYITFAHKGNKVMGFFEKDEISGWKVAFDIKYEESLIKLIKDKNKTVKIDFVNK